MSTRTIESPGVQINEVDLSTRTTLPVGTKVLIHGFASQGPTDELIQVSNSTELDQIFFGGSGPTNTAEIYFYQSCKEVLNSPATLYVTRLPYGSGGGVGFSGEYSALAYPVSSNGSSIVASSALALNTPVVVPLTETQYLDIQSNAITWNTTAGVTVSSFDTLGNAAFFVINDAKTSIDEQYEGYYFALADNTTISVTGFNAITAVKTMGSDNSLKTLDTSLLGFNLTGVETSNDGNISEVVETSFNYNFADTSYNNSLVAMLFKLRTSTYATDPNKLYFVPVENYVGSLAEDDLRASPTNGQTESFYLADKINNGSTYLKMFVNPNISKRATINQLYNNSKTLNPIGSYTPCKSIGNTSKYIGSVPTKVERALTLVENIRTLDLDVIAAAGLETIWAYVAKDSADGSTTFDDTANVATQLSDLANPTTGISSAFRGYHNTVFNLYNNFAQNTRKDCIAISDPIRGIFVQGDNFKTLDRKDRNFTSHVYNPLKNLYATANANYSAAYANWSQIYDNNTAKFVWVPTSGWMAAIMARLDANFHPWGAPFGLNNGVLRNITDIAIKPNQKQQDALYRIGINPIVYLQGDGFVVWGQKTLQAKPSAFDRINVRRLFLTMERATLKTMNYFVGQPNSVFTRARVVNVLKPLFDLAKNNEGMYDYIIICDERNNTSDVIDDNTMKVDIYIKPTRTAEFIIVTFYATRTDASFSELIS